MVHQKCQELIKPIGARKPDAPSYTTISTACSYCNQPGAIIDCEKCHQYFHYYPCSQYYWKEKQLSEIANLGTEKKKNDNVVGSVSAIVHNNFPDALTWPKFICPSAACLKTLRRKQVRSCDRPEAPA